jgi:Na+/H+ antiporter NhaD/arsenite permease-like protein
LRQTNQNPSKAIKIAVVFPSRKFHLMNTLLILIFVVAYAAIAFEHPIKINKSASALLGAGLLWSIYAVMTGDPGHVSEHLGETLIGTAQIVFFLMGAMTIVEVIDAHDGFDVVTAQIRTTSLSSLMWLVCIVTFFLSAVLDNLTSAIVMVSLMKKLLDSRDERLLFAGMIVIAANAGGAWSPIGDVTTTMLWIGGQITASSIIGALFFPSLVNLLVPLAIVSYSLRGKVVVEPRQDPNQAQGPGSTERERNIMFFLGLGVLIAVPAFKTITHLPPFMGVLLGLGVLWLVGDLLHGNKTEEEREHLNLTSALNRIDMASIVFFIGILLAVATLEHSGILPALAGWLDTAVGRQDLIVLLIGIVSAIVDNVPLVAAAIGMYSLDQYGPNSFLWQFLAYCAGTGGSILIIGSAAGVAAMGLERIDFVWYVKKISGLAFAGYFAGALAYIIQISLFN